MVTDAPASLAAVSIRLRGRNGFPQNSTKLITLAQHYLDTLKGQKVSYCNEFQPPACFHHLLQGDIYLVNKISAAFTYAALIIVRRGGSPAADQLASHMPTHARLGKSINHLADARGKLP